MNRLKRAAEALGLPSGDRLRSYLIKSLVTALALLGVALNAGVANAATLTSASVALSDPRPTTSGVTYTMTVSGVSATALRCIQATFVTTPSGSTAVPSLVASSATVNAGSTLLGGSTGTWNVTDTANSVKYTNTTNTVAPTTTSGATFIMQAIQNGNTADTSYWVQFKTFSDSGCATPIDNTTVGFIYTNGSTLSLTVDQTLSFTVNAVAASQSCAGATTTQASTSTTIPFGTVTTATNGLVCQDLTAATNASSGYTIYARYTGQLANALSQPLADWTGSNSNPTTFPTAGSNTEAYGYSTNDTTLGTGTAGRFASNKFAALTTSNNEVAYESAGVTSTTYRLAHEVQIATTTKPGTYQTTVVYTCTPVY